jgi:CRISPR-associated protein Cas7/Csd2, subtype I-C/DVULG
MNLLNHKIDFVALISVKMANPNGDPLNGNRPRTDYNGLGEISDVCIKRKIRNRMQDLGNSIFVQSDERADDEYKSLSERASKSIEKIKDRDEYARTACEKWLDVRSFGQVFAFKSTEKSGVSVGVRGPVSIHQAVSVSPVEVYSMQITKSVNSEPSEKKSSDTMGMKHMVRFGLYVMKGSINVQLAQKTGFTEADAAVIKECLLTLFENDSSSARPDGTMEVSKLYWWEHNCPSGQHSSAKVHRLVQVAQKDGVEMPKSIDDYEITVEELPNLKCEEIDGL